MFPNLSIPYRVMHRPRKQILFPPSKRRRRHSAQSLPFPFSPGCKQGSLGLRREGGRQKDVIFPLPISPPFVVVLFHCSGGRPIRPSAPVLLIRRRRRLTRSPPPPSSLHPPRSLQRHRETDRAKMTKMTGEEESYFWPIN